MANNTTTVKTPPVFTPKTLAKDQYAKFTKSDINSLLTQSVKAHENLSLQLKEAQALQKQWANQSSKYERILDAIKISLGKIGTPSRPLWWWAIKNVSALAQLVKDIISIVRED